MTWCPQCRGSLDDDDLDPYDDDRMSQSLCCDCQAEKEDQDDEEVTA